MRLPAKDFVKLCRARDREGWPLLVPNLVWLPREWQIAADVDCMSTYIGSSVPFALDPDDFEMVTFSPDDPIS